MKRLTTLLIVLFLVCPVLGKTKAQPKLLNTKSSKADVVVKLLQKQWDSSDTFQAQFKQLVHAKKMGTRDTSEGKVFVKKPGKLRWESKTDNSVQILNGSQFTVITKNERRKTTQVEIFTKATQAVDSLMLKFLSGRSKFKENYKFTLEGETSMEFMVRFIPKSSKGESLVAEIGKKSYLLRALTTEDSESRVRVEFSDVKTGLKLPNSLFVYQPKPTDTVLRQ